MTLPDGAVSRARAVFAAVGPVPKDATILAAIEAALRPPVAPRQLPPGTPKRYLTRREIIQVPCPLCHAESGDQCRRETGHTRGKVHIERSAKARFELPEQVGEQDRTAYFEAKAHT